MIDDRSVVDSTDRLNRTMAHPGLNVGHPGPKPETPLIGAWTPSGWLRPRSPPRGVPYRYGGASRSGVDCSGLVLQVHKKLGKDLPRTAAEQYRLGTRLRSPRPVKLVFGNFNGGRSMEHVGLGAGDGRIIDAPYPGTVVRYDEIYPRHTLGYKRLLPSG